MTAETNAQLKSIQTITVYRYTATFKAVKTEVTKIDNKSKLISCN